MIRSVREDDWPQIYALYCWYVQNSTANLGWENPAEDTFIAEQQTIAKRYPYLIAEQEGMLIGYGCLHPFLAKEAYQFDAEFTIYFVQGPHYGLPKALMNQLIEQARAMGIVRLIGCTTASNMPSLQFQEQFGFSVYGMLANAAYKNGQWHDVLWTEKMLGPLPEHPAPIQPCTLQERKDYGR